MASAFSESVFFSVNSLLGRIYGGSASSHDYMLYLVGLLLMNIMMRGWIYGKKRTIRPVEICVLLIPMLYVVLILFTCVSQGTVAEAIPSEILYLIMWQYMAILSVLNLQYYCSMDSIIYAVDWFVMLVFLSGCRAAISSMGQASNSMDTFGGATYQAASYFMAFAFGINTLLLLIKRKVCYLQKMHIYVSNIVRMAISGILVCLVLFSGGRAGIVVVFVYLLVLTWWCWINKRFSMNIWCFGAILCLALLLFVLTVLMDNPIFSLRFGRVFEYITSSGIDMSKTSGRDKIYAFYWECIKQKPVLGYGILSFEYMNEYAPHNIILQILVEGGFIYLILCIGVVGWIYRKWMYNKSLSKYFMIIMAIYPMVKTMFSANYLNDEVFWFAVMWGVLVKPENEHFLKKRNDKLWERERK